MSPCALNSAGSIQFRKESNQHGQSMTNQPQYAQVPDVSLFAASKSTGRTTGDALSLPVLSCARINMMTRASTKAIFGAAAALAGLAVLPVMVAQKTQSEVQETTAAMAPLPGVLSRAALKPPIRSRKVRLEFSPDGKYLLLQNESGLFLFATKPLKPALHIDADYLYPVRFSPDSQTLSGVSFALRTARWRIPSGETVSTGELQVSGGCISGDVSPDGELFVCHDPDLDVHIFDLRTQHEIFREEPRLRIPQSVTVPFALPRNNVDPTALGLVSVRSLQIFANEGLYPDKFAFSPDGTVCGVSGPQEISLWNVPAKRKVSVPGALTKYPGAGICFLDATRVLITGVPQHAEIVSLSLGKVVGKLDFDVPMAALASNHRYLIAEERESASKRLYDVEEKRLLNVPDNIAMDLREDVLAVFDATGQLHLFHFGDKAPFASTVVPLEGSPASFAAAASPKLDLLAFGFGQETGLYRVDTGQRVLSLGYSSKVSVPDSRFAYALNPVEDRKAMDVLEVDAASAQVSSPWQSETDFIRATPSVLLEYELLGPKQHVPEVLPDGKIPFQLTARVPASGDALWEKRFITSHPVPFVDSQGKNLVLAWEASTEAARSAAKRCPKAWPSFQDSKPTRNDTFFEVLDSTTGQTRGGILVRTGSGPLSFDSVAAVGSMLIVAKAGGRVTLYSLHDGEVKARLNGSMLAADEQTQLLTLVENDTHLGIYDLRNGKKLAMRHFGQPILYVHFSEDGKRLLVLTRQQIVYVLDAGDAAKTAN
jgi:hypothetical protein